jgi:hypothetical protein
MVGVHINEVGQRKGPGQPGGGLTGEELIPSFPDCHFSVNEIVELTKSNLGKLATQSTVTEADISGTITQDKVAGLIADLAAKTNTSILGGLATKSAVGESDISGTVSQNKITGLVTALAEKADNSALGALAVKSTIDDADISGTAAIAQSKIAGLNTTISGAVTTHEATTNHPTATASVKGMMSSIDKTKLDGLTGIPAWNTITNTPTTVAGYGIEDAATLVGGKIPTTQLPNDYLVNTSTVNSQAQMLALNFQQGDFCYRSDVSAYFDLSGSNPAILGNWQQRQSSSIRSINQQTGPDIVIGAVDVGAEAFGAVSAHELATNHPIATDSVKGMMSSEDKAKLNGVATGATANSPDAFLLSRANQTGSQAASTVTGLGALAVKSTINDADISGTAAIAQSKIAGLTTALAAKQNVLSAASDLAAANLTLSGKLVATPIAGQTVAATSTIVTAGNVIQINSSSHLEITTASPIAAGTEGQQIVLFNNGFYSIYIQSLLTGLRPKSSCVLVYIGGLWNLISSPVMSSVLGKNQSFVFANNAVIEVNDDYTIMCKDASGVQQSQEVAVIGTKADVNRGFMIYNDGGWGVAGYYKYSLGANNIVLPAITSNLAEYKCF